MLATPFASSIANVISIMQKAIVILCFVAALCSSARLSAGQSLPATAGTATVSTVAPIYLAPDATRTPLRTAAVNTVLRVLEDQGEWLKVEFQDPQYGRRVGFVQARNVRVVLAEQQPLDLSIPLEQPAATPAPPQPRAITSAATDATRPAIGSEQVERSGFLIGLSAGGGALFCTDCDTMPGGAGGFQIGGMINNRFGIMFDGIAVVDSEDEVAMAVDTLAVQGWVSPRAWVKGGAGFGVVTDLFGDCCSETGFALMGGAGVELLQKRKFVMDLQGRVATTQLEGGRRNMFTVMLGFNWY